MMGKTLVEARSSASNRNSRKRAANNPLQRRSFPYGVYFAIEGEVIVIVAVSRPARHCRMATSRPMSEVERPRALKHVSQ